MSLLTLVLGRHPFHLSFSCVLQLVSGIPLQKSLFFLWDHTLLTRKEWPLRSNNLMYLSLGVVPAIIWFREGFVLEKETGPLVGCKERALSPETPLSPLMTCQWKKVNYSLRGERWTEETTGWHTSWKALLLCLFLLHSCSNPASDGVGAAAMLRFLEPHRLLSTC